MYNIPYNLHVNINSYFNIKNLLSIRITPETYKFSLGVQTCPSFIYGISRFFYISVFNGRTCKIMRYASFGCPIIFLLEGAFHQIGVELIFISVLLRFKKSFNITMFKSWGMFLKKVCL